jgi:hypothetical protein
MTAEDSGKTAGHANLRPWQPAQSGNPGGQPRRDPVTGELRKQMTPEVAADIVGSLILLARCPPKSSSTPSTASWTELKENRLSGWSTARRARFDPIGAALDEYSVDELRGMLRVLRDQATEGERSSQAGDS